jgi:hypothetical protein
MYVQTYIKMSWNDPRLTWNPDDFSKSQFTYAHVRDIWIPDIAVYNS